MPITPFLRGQAFEPDTIEAMSAALTQACAALGLVDRADPITELVARHIVELAQRGIRTQTALYLATIQEFTPTHNEAAPSGVARRTLVNVKNTVAPAVRREAKEDWN